MSTRPDGATRLERVVDEFQGKFEAGKKDRILRDQVLQWMEDEDIEVMGALFAFINKERHYSRIEPSLEYRHYEAFLMRYYSRCLCENPDGTWADSRYTAAMSLAAWLEGIWHDPDVPRSALRQWKAWLARLYKSGDSDVKTAIVTATLEHLFQEREFAEFFSDWSEDNVLRVAYSEAKHEDEPRASK